MKGKIDYSPIWVNKKMHEDVDDVVGQWLGKYKDWLAKGQCHVIRVDALDGVEKRVAKTRDVGCDCWWDFAKGFANEFELNSQGQKTECWMTFGKCYRRDIESVWGSYMLLIAMQKLGIPEVDYVPAAVYNEVEDEVRKCCEFFEVEPKGAAAVLELHFANLAAQAKRNEMCMTCKIAQAKELEEIRKEIVAWRSQTDKVDKAIRQKLDDIEGISE